jgi:hypothetical protein
MLSNEILALGDKLWALGKGNNINCLMLTAYSPKRVNAN